LLAILQAAGWPIWLLLIASIVATALIIERLITCAARASCRQAC
jgi:biopolymer transport protein ExbB